jgi:hypothetical protein
MLVPLGGLAVRGFTDLHLPARREGPDGSRPRAREGKVESGYSAESLEFQIMREQVEALTHATTIEARLGGDEFSVAPPRLRSFRELLSTVRAQADSS